MGNSSSSQKNGNAINVKSKRTSKKAPTSSSSRVTKTIKKSNKNGKTSKSASEGHCSQKPLLSAESEKVQEPMSLQNYLSDDEGTKQTVPHADDSYMGSSFDTANSPASKVIESGGSHLIDLGALDNGSNGQIMIPGKIEKKFENDSDADDEGETSYISPSIRKSPFKVNSDDNLSEISPIKTRNILPDNDKENNKKQPKRVPTARPQLISTRQVSEASQLTNLTNFTSADQSMPSLYHGNGLCGEQGETDSVASDSLFSNHSTDLESIANESRDPSLSDLSFSPSLGSLDLKRKKRRTELLAKKRSAMLQRQQRSPSKKQSGRPTANNAFETLPRHLIKSALVRQAATTLKDERFIQKRILKLGTVTAAKVHVADLACLHKREIKDAKRRERLGEDAPMPSASTFADGDDATSVTLESFDLFQKCILDLCGIQMVDVDLDRDSGLVDVDDDAPEEPDSSSVTAPISEPEVVDKLPEISTSDGGRALYYLAKFTLGKEWLEEAMDYYRASLFLFLLELGLREPSLLDDSDDCTGFFYVTIANAGSTVFTSAHQDLANLLTKMGDVHGKFEEISDALHAYRAAQVFWKKFLSETNIATVEDCESIADMDELNEHAAAVEGLALTHNRIGGVYCSRGDLDAAMKSFNEALELQVEALGDNHLEVAKTLHNIGVTHRHQDDLDQALHFYKRAYHIFELNLGKEHLDTVRTLHNIGGVYRRKKDYENAMACFRDVLRVRRILLGDHHPSVSITLVSIAAVLRRSGRKEEANKFYAEAMK